MNKGPLNFTVTGGSVNLGNIITGDHNTVTNTQTITTQSDPALAASLDAALKPVTDAIAATKPEVQAAANEKVEAIKAEAMKGKDAENDKVFNLLDTLLDLAPEAAKAVVTSFGFPVFAGLAGGAVGGLIKGLHRSA